MKLDQEIGGSDAVEGAPAPVREVHRTAGRLRYRIAALFADQLLGEALEQSLTAVPGVQSVRVNRRASSLIVHGDALALADALPSLIGEVLGCTAAAGAPARRARRSPRPAPLPGRKSTGPAVAARRGKLPVVESPATAQSDWHAQSLEKLISRLQTDLDTGIGQDTAEERLLTDGPNALPRLAGRGELRILLEQFNTAPVAMLGASAAISLATAAPVDAMVILAVIGINAAIGFVTERQAEKTIASLAVIEANHVKVLRDGVVRTTDAEALVVGDVVLLEPGTRIAADARLFKSHNLTVDESSLTGESLPVKKYPEDSCPTIQPLADRMNMLHMGTTVAGGDGRAVVVATGARTELGQIQALAASTTQPATPMQRQLGTVSTQLALLSSAVCGLVFVAGLLRGQSRLTMLNTSISLAVAAVPEGLPAIANSLLASGIRRMRSKNIAARRLDAIENLGAIDVLCLDKTGTLTENVMQVVEVHSGSRVVAGIARGRGEKAALYKAIEPKLLQTLVLCNESEIGDDGVLRGSATENALLELAIRAGVDVARLRSAMPQLKLRYRSEQRPYMVTLHRYPRRKGAFIAVKGRPKEVLARCTRAKWGNRVVALDERLRAEIIRRNEALMAKAYRVLGVAWKRQEEHTLGATAGLTWLGLVAMADPIRPEVLALLPRIREAGIKPIILTGDQRGTAAAIGRQLHLNGEGETTVVGADEIATQSIEELRQTVENAHVFARVSPAMKLKLVQALQLNGRRVAMTGDGINDGPALKIADVGIAMGASGTEVARGMADVVLADDHLESIIDAIASGRANYTNLQKAIEYLLSTNFSEIEVMFGAILAGLPTPLSPIQLLWINLMTDVFPALAIGMEAPEWDVLKRPPEDLAEGVISRKRLGGLFGQSLVITGFTMGSYLYGIARHGAGARANTMAFSSLTIAQLLHSIAARSRSTSLYSAKRPPPNPYLRSALGGSLLLQLATLAVPGLRRLFGTTTIDVADALVIGATASAPLLINEAVKEARMRALRTRASEENGDDTTAAG